MSMFWGCFSFYDVDSLKPITRMMNSTKYIDTVKAKAISMLSSKPIEDPILKQDWALSHISIIYLKFFCENGICVIKWPWNSLDLNPTGNLWSNIKIRLRLCDKAKAYGNHYLPMVQRPENQREVQKFY